MTRWLAMTIALFASVSTGSCDAPSRRPAAQMERSQRAPTVRMLVIEVSPQGLRIISQQDLSRPWRAPRAERPGHRGSWSVLSADGREIATGRFRLPRGIHALLRPPDGPAEAVHIPTDRQVIWLRVPVSAGATRLRLRDRRKGIALGEVPL